MGHRVSESDMTEQLSTSSVYVDSGTSVLQLGLSEWKSDRHELVTGKAPQGMDHSKLELGFIPSIWFYCN